MSSDGRVSKDNIVGVAMSEDESRVFECQLNGGDKGQNTQSLGSARCFSVGPVASQAVSKSDDCGRPRCTSKSGDLGCVAMQARWMVVEPKVVLLGPPLLVTVCK